MPTIRNGAPAPTTTTPTTRPDAPSTNRLATTQAEPPGWSTFADSFAENPATQLEVLRNKAKELGRPEVVAPLSGLRLTDDSHHSVASNTLRNYPVKDIYGALFTEQPQNPAFEAFQNAFVAAPATELEKLRARANELGKPEVMAPFTGLQLVDGGHHSIASNALRNYPFESAFEALYE